MITQTVSTPMPAMVVAKNNKPQATPEDLIERTTRNWRIVCRYLDILGPEAAAEFRARWESALGISFVEARARALRQTLFAATDRLEPEVLALAEAQVIAAESEGLILVGAKEILTEARNSRHALGCLLAADWTIRRLQALEKAKKSLSTAKFVANKKIAPQIDRRALNHLLSEAEALLRSDPFAALRFLNEKVWSELNALIKKSQTCPQSVNGRTGKTARRSVDYHRRQAEHQRERAALSKSMKGGAAKAK